MGPDTVIEISRQSLIVIIMLSAPILVTALAVGLLIGLFQAATQINEMTLSFIPKLLAVAVAILVAGPWMLRLLLDFTQRLFEKIPGLVG